MPSTFQYALFHLKKSAPAPSEASGIVPDARPDLRRRRRCGRWGRPGQRVEALGRRGDDHVAAAGGRRRRWQIGGGKVEEAVVGGGKVQGLLEEGEDDLALDGGMDGGGSSWGNRSGRAENSFPISAPLKDHP